MQRLKLSDIEFKYKVHGSGPVLICIHGFPLSHELWTPLAELIGDRVRLVMPDLRGLGGSSASPTASMQTYADDLAALLDHLGIKEPVTVIGLSMGGYIALEFMRRHGDRANGLILADTRAENDAPAKAAERAQAAQRCLKEGVDFLVEAMLPNLFADDASQELKNQWRDIMSRSNPMGVAAALVAMGERPDSVPSLGSIRVPTLVIVGEKDAITPPDAARVMSDGIDGATLEILPGVGHMSAVEAPSDFARLVGAFIRNCK